MFFHLPPESGWVYTEGVGSLSLVPAVFQYLTDHLFLTEQGGRREVFMRCLPSVYPRGILKTGRDILLLRNGTIEEDAQPFGEVVEFSDVARPVVVHDHLLGFR